MKLNSIKGTSIFLLPCCLVVLFTVQQSCRFLYEKKDYHDLIKFEFVDPLEKVLAEASYFPPKEAISEVVRGENATFQFVVRSTNTIHNLKVSVEQANNGDKNLPPAKVGFIGYVKVGRTIKNYSRDRLVSSSGYYPDPVLEQESVDVDLENNQPIWVSIPIPISAEQGLYKGKITVSGKVNNRNFSMSKDYLVKIYPVTVEKTSLWVANWVKFDTTYLKHMNGGKVFKPFSEQHWGYIRSLAKIMAEYRSNVARISPLDFSQFTYEKGEWNIDFSNFDKVVDIFIEEGVIGRIEGSFIGGRESTWGSQFIVMVPNDCFNPQKKFDSLPISDSRAQEFYNCFLGALNTHLKDKGWDKIYMQHIADEPIDQNVKSYIEIAQFVKNIVPDFRIIEACLSKNLDGIIDIWVPQLDFVHKDYSYFNKQNNIGKEVWFYTCNSPSGEYGNRFIELPLLKTRYLHWVNFKYHISGYLHHGLNKWRGNIDPFGEQSRIFEGGVILPGGDSWIIYPKDGKLFSSIRFDAMRDGIVDYELLKMLEIKHPGKAKDIINKVVYDFDKYDNNIEAFRDQRRNLMELLSE